MSPWEGASAHLCSLGRSHEKPRVGRKRRTTPRRAPVGGDGSRRAAEALSRAAILPSAQGAPVLLLPRFRGAFFLQWDGAAACGDHVTPASKSAGNFTLEPREAGACEPGTRAARWSCRDEASVTGSCSVGRAGDGRGQGPESPWRPQRAPAPPGVVPLSPQILPLCLIWLVTCHPHATLRHARPAPVAPCSL